jgi:hypothetical protein
MHSLYYESVPFSKQTHMPLAKKNTFYLLHTRQGRENLKYSTFAIQMSANMFTL